MMKFVKIIFFCIAATLFTGCSTHSPMRMSNATTVKNRATTTYPPHTNKVFITEAALPDSMPYERLGQIGVGMTTYSSMNEVKKRMANKARELGADAVIELHTWKQPSGWAWVAPQGEGQSVRIKNRSSIDFSQMEGEWL